MENSEKYYDRNLESNISVSDILNLETRPEDEKESFGRLSKRHIDHGEVSLMVRVPYSSPTSSDNEENVTSIETDDDEEDTFVPFDVSVFRNKSIDNNIQADCKTLPTTTRQNRRKSACTCKCKQEEKDCKVPNKRKGSPRAASPAIPSREFNFPSSTENKLRTFKSEDCFGNMQKIRLRRSQSAQTSRTLHNSNSHYSTFRPQSAMNYQTPAKKLIVPNILNIQPENILKKHNLTVGRQTVKTLQYINDLHQKERNMKQERKKQLLSSRVVLSEGLEDLCISSSVRPQSATFSTGRQKPGRNVNQLNYNQQYRIPKEILKKEIEDVAKVNISCIDACQEPINRSSNKNEDRAKNISGSSLISRSRTANVLHRVKFQ